MLSRAARVDALVTKPREGVRPTTRKVLESLFAILDGVIERWDGLRVLDAFAGTGQLGAEALARGAHVTFIEKSGAVASDLRRRYRAASAVVVLRGDALEQLAKLRGPFDLVFLDPPYSAGLASDALALLTAHGLVAPEGWVVAEHHHKDSMPEARSSLRLVRRQRYGETALSMYRGEAAPEEGAEDVCEQPGERGASIEVREAGGSDA